MKVLIGFVVLLIGALSLAAQPQGPGNRPNMPGNNVVGKVTSTSKDTLVITPLAGGDSVTIKLGSETRLMKDRQPVKIDDIKTGDVVFARGNLSGNSMDARMVGVVPPDMVQRFQQGGGPGGFQGGPGAGFNREDMGKKFIAGEVKAINETKLTIARPDGQTQDIEVDENTSFKHGNESITFPDIKIGDFVRGPGDLKNNVFVPKELTVGRPRMGFGRGGDSASPNTSPDKSPAAAPPKN